MKSLFLRSSLVTVAIVSLAFFWSRVFAIAADVAEAGESPIEVSIAIPLHNRDHQREIIYGGPKPHFHVLVSNVSDEPQNIWKEWCSWGYYTLSFEVTDPDGKTRSVTKKMPHFWTVNFPDDWTIPPHESLVLEVDFADNDTWEPFPRRTGDRLSFKMRAVFEIRADEEAKKSSVWTGRVISKEATYTACDPR